MEYLIRRQKEGLHNHSSDPKLNRVWFQSLDLKLKYRQWRP